MQQAMEYVYTVWQEGSFSRAAQKLYLSQPALSIAVRKVEAELGLPLFDRGTQPLSLTPAGELYLQTAKRIRAEEAALRRGLDDLSGLSTGRLRLGGASMYVAYLVPPVLAKFMKRYPGVQVELNEYFAGEQPGRLLAGDVDLIINAQPLDPNVFLQTAFTREHLLLAVPKTCPLNRENAAFALSRRDILAGRHLAPDCPRIGMQVFREEYFLLMGEGNDLAERAQQLCREAGFTPRTRLFPNQLISAYQLAAQGLGLILATDTMVVHDTTAAFCYYLPDSPLVERPVLFTTLRGRYLGLPAQEFCRMTAADFKAKARR